MDLVGEIVERDIVPPLEPAKTESGSGFPSAKKLQEKRLQKRQERQGKSTSKERELPTKIKSSQLNKRQSEAEKIHQENLDKLAGMSLDDIEQEKRELMQGLDPKLIETLTKRSIEREEKDRHDHQHAEGFGGWIGGVRTEKGLSDLSQLDDNDINRALGIESGDHSFINDPQVDEPKDEPRDDHVARRSSSTSEKKVRFDDVATVKYEDIKDKDIEIDESGWEDVEDINDITEAPEDYQLVNEEEEEEMEVHFPKPKQKNPEFGDDLDLNDPRFYDKLHDKYYPDLPKETSKLAWMTDPVPQQRSTTYESISDMRFDFQGNLLELNPSNDAKEVPTYLGLHHHSDNPQLPGYTLQELVHLSRSVVPGQRCLSIQMLGRILHKLGLHKYNILPIPEVEDGNEHFVANVRKIIGEFETMMWQLIEELRIIESIEEAADESKTRNMSVRNYAIEALWLWRQGGGKPKERDNEEEMIKNLM